MGKERTGGRGRVLGRGCEEQRRENYQWFASRPRDANGRLDRVDDRGVETPRRRVWLEANLPGPYSFAPSTTVTVVVFVAPAGAYAGTSTSMTTSMESPGSIVTASVSDVTPSAA